MIFLVDKFHALLGYLIIGILHFQNILQIPRFESVLQTYQLDMICVQNRYSAQVRKRTDNKNLIGKRTGKWGMAIEITYIAHNKNYRYDNHRGKKLLLRNREFHIFPGKCMLHIISRCHTDCRRYTQGICRDLSAVRR